MEKTVKIGLLGAGTVGSGVLQVLRENAREVSLKAGASVEIKTVLVRDAKKQRPNMEGIVATDKIEDILEETLGMREFSRKKALYATSFEAFSTSKNRQFVYELVISSSRDSVRDTAPKVGSQSMDRGETGG